MTKLEKLINEFCPNGIEYKKLGDIATISRGGIFQKKDFTEYGIPCIHYGQIYTRYGLSADKTITYLAGAASEKAKYAEPNDIVMAVTSENVNDVCKCVAWIGSERVAVSGHTAIIHHNQNAKYLSYYFNSEHFYKQKVKLAHGTKVIEVTPDKLGNVKIPVPPLEVQCEIVRILDNFTELTKELTKELTARKKQYEYYREKLLTFNKNIMLKTLDELCDISAGGDVPKESMSKEKTERYCVPIISNGIGNNALYGYTDVPKITKAAVTVAARGTIGYAEFRDYPYFPIIRLLSVIPKDKTLLNTKYLYYCLQGKRYNVPTSGISQLTAPMLKKEKIPIPSLEVQERIVNVLDNFDAICKDLNIGLPAEIEARQKQYEYYRDLLLTFVEQGNTILTDRQTLIKLLQYVFGTVYVRLGDVATITRGGNFQKKDFAVKGFPCIHYGQIYTNYGVYADKTIKNISEEAAEKSKKAVKNDIVMAVTSENIDDVCKCVAWLGNDEIAVSGHTAIIHHEQNPKFLAYYFHTEDFYKQKKKLAHGTKVIEVTPDKLNDIIIPLPGIEEQERIVSVLDRFDTLCNDLSSGLPAEIEARQKQYEYYRDRLLTFKELSE